MSGMNPNNRFISPTEDFNKAGGEGTLNVNVVGNMNEISNRTTERLFQSVAEAPQSSELIVSSTSRTRGTPFDFTTDIGGPLYRARTARLAAAVMPALPNINRSNNQVVMQAIFKSVGSSPNIAVFVLPIPLQFTIPYGYYSPSRFEDVFSSLLHDQFESMIGLKMGEDIGGDEWILTAFQNLTVTSRIGTESFRVEIVVTSDLTRLIAQPSAITRDLVGFQFTFWFDETCSFIQRGIHMVPFLGTTLLPTTIGVDSTLDFPFPSSKEDADIAGKYPYEYFFSQPASFYYSRFISVLSENLSLYTFGESRVDRAAGGGGTGKIIGVFSTTRYNGNAGMGPFAGVDVLKGVEGPVLGIRNAQLKLNELIDFRFVDEYGIDLDQIFPIDNVGGPTLAFNLTY